jgi:hypothetical protein
MRTISLHLLGVIAALMVFGAVMFDLFCHPSALLRDLAEANGDQEAS